MTRFYLYYSAFILLGFVLINGSCSFTEKIRDGEMAYDRKQYAVAAEMLEDEYRRSNQEDVRARKAFLVAHSYQRMNKNKEAVTWYRKAYEEGYGQEALHQYALALKRNQQYRQAIEIWEQLMNEEPKQKYRRELGICRQVIDWLDRQDEQPYDVFRTSFNSSASDYAPVYFPDEHLVFSSDRSSATGEQTYKWTGRAYSDLYMADLKTGNVTRFSPLINTDHNEGTIAFDEDFSMMIFSRCFQFAGEEDEYCKLMVSHRQGSGWSKPELLPFMQEQINYGHPALSEDGRVLVFSSDAPDGIGGYDLYACKYEAGSWSSPILMSDRINTVGDEMFPSIDRDTLYFSSDHLPGLGGLDVFKTYQRANGSWSPPENLMPPINSGGDDFGLTIRKTTDSYRDNIMEGYFTSSRPGGMGSDDIYSFKYDPSKKPAVASKEQVDKKPEKEEVVLLLEGTVRTPEYTEKGNPNSPRSGYRPLDSSRVVIEKGTSKQILYTDASGGYRDTIEYGKDYEISVSKDEFLGSNRKLSSKNISKPASGVQSLIADFVLNKIYLNREIVLKNIYYDYDKWNIREDAEPTLDSLAQILRWNPEIKIQMASHTDCRGTDAYNQELSTKRAQSAVDYLISEGGIDPDRLSAKGYGESKPAVSCPCEECTEEEHQRNRRTTFKILDKASNE